MLIKLRNAFYQVQCDAFVNLATDLLDIRPILRRARAFVRKSLLTQLHESYITSANQFKGLISADAETISMSRRQWKVNQRATHSGRIKLGKGEYG